MPADYEAVRDSLIKKFMKKGMKRANAVKKAKKMAAIWYYKKHGKPVRHGE